MAILRKHLKPKMRREQIIAAADAIIQKVGVEEFTIDKVVDYLGIAKGTVYKYFETKDNVLAEVCTKALNQMLNYFKVSERSSPEGLEKTKAIMMSCYHYSNDCPRYFELVVYLERPEFQTKAESHKKASTELQNFFTNHIKKQQEKGYINKDVDPIMANCMAWGTTMGMMQFLDAKRNFIENIEELTQKQLMESYVSVMVRGMGT